MVLLETPDALPTSLPLDPALVLLLRVAGGNAIHSIPSDERQSWRRRGVCHNERRWVSSHSVDCSQRILYVFLTGVGCSEGVGCVCVFGVCVCSVSFKKNMQDGAK